MKSKFLILFLLLIVTAGNPGCSKKEEAAVVSDQGVAVSETAALPELEQNKMYLINQPPEKLQEQDTSFEPVSHEQEVVSEEDLALQGPPMD